MKVKSVQTGVLWVTVVGIVLILFSLGGYYVYQSSQLRKQADAAKIERGGYVRRLLNAGTEKMLEPIKDNSAWDDLYNAVKNKDFDAIDECIGYMPETYAAGCVAVFDSTGKRIYDKVITPMPDSIFIFEGEGLVNFFKHSGQNTFTENLGGRLINYVGAGIVPSDDEYTRKEKPSGYILLLREITQDDIRNHCKSLGNIDAALFANEDDKNAFVNGLDGLDYLESTMRTCRGRVSAYVCFTYPDPAAGQLSEFARVFNFICIEMVLIFVLVLVYVNRKITHPLRNVSNSFKTEEIAPVLPLTKESNEFGQISNMMVGFFEQKEEIMMQNECMQDLNSSLTQAYNHMSDSISYASRLQKSMLLAHAPKEGWFSESFTIYHPKDIVGGDFYVCQSMGIYNIAVLGDCTGHGVPGAILASMGISFLYQVIDAPNFDFMPDTLLNRLRDKVISAFDVDETGKQINDGMDVAAVIYNKETHEAYFAGAGRPAVVVHDGELNVTKGDHMPIGRYVKTDDFKRTQLYLHPGDLVYLYSDGCTDQVGGEQRRKITAGKFQQYLLSISTLDFPTQKDSIETFFDTWRGDIPQTDDVSLLAFRV